MTRGLAAWTYGFFEMRAKLPCARGTWPAIWMLPERGGWPDGGEIDIMEKVGSEPKVIYATLHSGLFEHSDGTQRGAPGPRRLQRLPRLPARLATGYHDRR